MSALRLAGLYRYPVKSARGQSLGSSSIDAFGLSGDRRWMLVDGDGKFLSQRSVAGLALLGALVEADGLQLQYGGKRISVALPGRAAPVLEVEIWAARVPARLAASGVSDWISAQLQVDARLVYLPDDAVRHVDPAFAASGERVAFSDGFPLLVISQASLDYLNERLPAPVPMNRFRPNLVIDGAEPFAEDYWSRLQIGETIIELVKPCSRCVVPSIDQDTGKRDPSINRVLANFRRRDGQIFFGMNALGRDGNQLSVGDPVAVLH